MYLCHIDNNRIILKISAWNENERIGSTLGLGSSIDLAEEDAIKRLQRRLSSSRTIVDSENQTLSDQNTNVISEINSAEPVKG